MSEYSIPDYSDELKEALIAIGEFVIVEDRWMDGFFYKCSFCDSESSKLDNIEHSDQCLIPKAIELYQQWEQDAINSLG